MTTNAVQTNTDVTGRYIYPHLDADMKAVGM